MIQSFEIKLNRGFTEEEGERIDFSDGPLGGLGEMTPGFGDGPSDLICDIEAASLAEAFRIALSEISAYEGLHAVEVRIRGKRPVDLVNRVVKRRALRESSLLG